MQGPALEGGLSQRFPKALLVQVRDRLLGLVAGMEREKRHGNDDFGRPSRGLWTGL